MTWLYIFIGFIVLGEILKRAFNPKRSAQKIASSSEKLYSNLHEYAVVRTTDFPDLDHAYYDRVAAELAAMGFRHLGDFEDLTVSRQMRSMRTFVRYMAGLDGTTMAGIYQIKFRGFFRLLALLGVMPRKPFYLDLETEFSNGSFLATSNTEGSNFASPVPGITNQRRPQWTTSADLLTVHREGLGTLATRGFPPVTVTTARDYQMAQHRMQELKNRHLKSQGFVDLAQTKAIAENAGYHETNAELIGELAVIQRQRKATTPSTPPPLPPARHSAPAAA